METLNSVSVDEHMLTIITADRHCRTGVLPQGPMQVKVNSSGSSLVYCTPAAIVVVVCDNGTQEVSNKTYC